MNFFILSGFYKELEFFANSFLIRVYSEEILILNSLLVATNEIAVKFLRGR